MKKEEIWKAEFSHLSYDDITNTVFMYFNKGTVQNLGGKNELYEMEEFTIWVSRESYDKLRKELMDHEKPRII